MNRFFPVECKVLLRKLKDPHLAVMADRNIHPVRADPVQGFRKVVDNLLINVDRQTEVPVFFLFNACLDKRVST